MRSAGHKVAKERIRWKHSEAKEGNAMFMPQQVEPASSGGRAEGLAVGRGPLLIELADALFAAGWSRLHLLAVGGAPIDPERMAQCLRRARRTNPEAELCEAARLPAAAAAEIGAWREAVRPYRWVAYGSADGPSDEMRLLQEACREERKAFVPVLRIGQAGIAGPLARPDGGTAWESAWRRIHKSVLGLDEERTAFTAAAGALLAGVAAAALRRADPEADAGGGAAEPDSARSFYLLNLATLEGRFHAFIPHPLPLAAGNPEFARVADPMRLAEPPGDKAGEAAEKLPGGCANEAETDDSAKLPPEGAGDAGTDEEPLLACFERWTSPVAGIFRAWDEGELTQLPLSLCRVEPADPLSEGPARTLPPLIRAGITHAEARREAGLAGIEAYAARLAGPFLPAGPAPFGVGAGATAREALSRALLHALAEARKRGAAGRPPAARPLRLGRVDDARLRFEWRALAILQGTPAAALFNDGLGCPVVWVGAGGRWHGCVGFDAEGALRSALRRALLYAQCGEGALPEAQGWEAPDLKLLPEEPVTLEVEAGERSARQAQERLLPAVLNRLKRAGRRIAVWDLAVEPFLREDLGAVLGVALEGEEERT
jgi:hypothetical protein